MMAHADAKPVNLIFDESILKTNLLFKPKYIYKKSACEILGLTIEQFDNHKKTTKTPKEHVRGRRIMYELEEIETLLLKRDTSWQ